MAKKRFLYDINTELAQAIERMLYDILTHDLMQDSRVLLDTDRYRVIGKMTRDPNKKFGKPETILCITHVKLLEPGYLNLAPVISKGIFKCKPGKRGLKGKTIEDDIHRFCQTVGLDIDYAIATRRRNFTPEYIQYLQNELGDDYEEE